MRRLKFYLWSGFETYHAKYSPGWKCLWMSFFPRCWSPGCVVVFELVLVLSCLLQKECSGLGFLPLQPWSIRTGRARFLVPQCKLVTTPEMHEMLQPGLQFDVGNSDLGCFASSRGPYHTVKRAGTSAKQPDRREEREWGWEHQEGRRGWPQAGEMKPVVVLQIVCHRCPWDGSSEILKLVFRICSILRRLIFVGGRLIGFLFWLIQW